MIKTFIKSLRIRTKLIGITLIIVLLSLLGVSNLLVDQFGKALRNAADEDLGHLVSNMYSMCKVQQEMISRLNGDIFESPGHTVIKEESTQSLRNAIKDIKVGKTGYVYIMDSSGTLKIHPAIEGENIIGSKDSSGFMYIGAMTNEALKLGDGVLSTIRYPWLNPALGETAPRQKIAKYTYFEPWDWIIVAGTYEEEIYQSLYKTERYILILVLFSLVLVFILTVILSRIITTPIQELTEITTKMVDGDLSQRVNVQGTDEIGILGTSFNRMIAQIQDTTINLENMVSERTQELEESGERYRDLSRFLNSILDSATEYAIIALDFYGNIMEFNNGAEKIFGWKKDEVIGKENIAITMQPEDIEKGVLKEISRRTKEKGYHELEMMRIRKNGKRFPALSTITAIHDPSGKSSGFVVILRDISTRKNLERELRETKEFLENILESSIDVIITTDLKGKITYLNPIIEEVLKYSREELYGEHISLIYARGINQAREIMDLLMESERADNYEMMMISKEGEALYISTSLFLLRDEDDQLIGTAGIFKDITEQKVLEDKLRAAQARIVETSKMRALGELVAGVAHELNNPLMASKTIMHVIFNNIEEDWPERERLELIRKCNDRIEKIVEHLREFSRQSKPDMKELDLNTPMENALMITGQQLLNHNISIIRNMAEDLPKILGDANQLEQVFLNLISNARDAMDETTGPKELTIASFVVKEEGVPWVVLSLKDTGTGISEENLHKVLEPFFSTKPVGKGTGLGLSLCFGIIEAHEGRFEMRNRSGKGAEARVLIPVKEYEKE